MSERGAPFVLRTVNLPSDMDDELRARAFRLQRSEVDVHRYCLSEGLKRLSADAATAIDQFNAEIAKAEKAVYDYDRERLRIEANHRS